MPHNLTDVSAFTSPIPAIADGDAVGQAVNDPLAQSLANRTRWLYDKIGGVVYPYGRTSKFSPLGGDASPVYVPPAGSSTSADHLSARWLPHFLVAAGAGPGGRDLITLTGKIYTGLTFHTYTRCLNRGLPSGGSITLVQIQVTAGSAQATSTDRIAIEFAKVNFAGVRTSIGTGVATGSSGTQTISIDLSGSPEVIDLSTYTYHMLITSSAGAGSGTEDYVLGLGCSWIDAGPRG